MKKTNEYVHYLLADNGAEGRYRVQLYEEPGKLPVVICSKYIDHYVAANYCENLAAEVLLNVLPEKAVRARKNQKYFEFVDHIPELYMGWDSAPKETFDLVDFSDYRIRSGMKRRRVRDAGRGLQDAQSPYTRPSIGYARWKDANKATIEEMIGGEIEDYSHLMVEVVDPRDWKRTSEE